MRNNAICEETLDRHRSANGMYSEQVLSEVLISDGRWHIDASCYSAPLSVLSHMSRDDVVGAVVCCPGHWVALQHVDCVLWLLDSLKPWPVRLGSTGTHPCWLSCLRFAACSVYVVQSDVLRFPRKTLENQKHAQHSKRRLDKDALVKLRLGIKSPQHLHVA